MNSKEPNRNSRTEKRRFEYRQAKIRKWIYIVVGILAAVIVLTTLFGKSSSKKSLSDDRSTGVSHVNKSKKSSSVSDDPFYDIGKKHDKSKAKSSSSSSSQSSSSSVSSSSSAASSEAPAAATSGVDVQPNQDTSQAATNAQADTQAANTAAYATLAPTGGQALYSWAIAEGTTADAIYQLNPGMTAANWGLYVGRSIRIR